MVKIKTYYLGKGIVGSDYMIKVMCPGRACIISLLLLCVISYAHAKQCKEDVAIRTYMQQKHEELFPGETFEEMTNILTPAYGSTPMFSRHTYMSYRHSVDNKTSAGEALLGIYLTEEETRPGWLTTLLKTTKNVKDFLAQKRWKSSFFVMAITDANTPDGYVARCHHPWIFLNHEGHIKRFVAHYYSCAMLTVLSVGNYSSIVI